MNGITNAARGHEAQRFASFALTGGVAGLVNLVTRSIISRFAIYEVAVAFAYLLGMTTALHFARRLVFEATGSSWMRKYRHFELVNVFAFGQVWVVSVGPARTVFPRPGFDWYPGEVADLFGFVNPIVTSSYLHAHFSFRQIATPKAGDRP